MLKKKIVEVMQQSYSGINPSIADWKGQEITDFQEDLRIRVNAHISEKWFYTHMKSGQSSVPRIDMLNLLSRYAGYANWDDFVFKNKERISDETHPGHKYTRSNRFFILIPLLTLVIVCIFYGLFRLFNTREYNFCFHDADTREAIAGNRIEIRLLHEGESPVNYLSGPDGCFRLKTDQSKVKMVVAAQYYHTDTITRILKKLELNETVYLHANDYAMMIHYFSMMKVDDWEKRRKSLEAMIDDEAMICQVVNDREAKGMILYNKQEFIGRMTLPSGSLKNLEILGTTYRNEKIMVLRFRINDQK